MYYNWFIIVQSEQIWLVYFIKEQKNTFGTSEPKIWDTDHPYHGEKAQIGFKKWVDELQLLYPHTSVWIWLECFINEWKKMLGYSEAKICDLGPRTIE